MVKMNMNAQTREVEQYLDSWNKAMVEADTSVLGSMMDDGLVLHHLTGATQTKQEWLSDVADGVFRYHRIETRDLKITPQKDGTVVVHSVAAVTATVYGAHGTWTLRGNARLAKRGGKWTRIE